jgi:hypothetical protein
MAERSEDKEAGLDEAMGRRKRQVWPNLNVSGPKRFKE